VHLRWFTQDWAEMHHRLLMDDFGIDDRGVFSEVSKPFPPEFADQVYDTIRTLRQEFGAFVITAAPYMSREETHRYYTDLTYVNSPHCRQAWRTLWIHANGSTGFCPDQWIASYSIGNVKTTPIDEMWQGEAARKFRRAQTTHGLWPGCARCCMTNKDDA
jgi:radical SAM protein with 4Fe4S-binding SPASM domain